MSDIQALGEEVMSLLDDAMKMVVGLSEDDSQYNLMFIREKVAKCATYQEKISDVMMKLTRVSIEVQRVAAGKKLGLLQKKNTLKGSEEYKAQLREDKAAWYQEQIGADEEAAEEWNTLKRVVSEVKEAVSERAQTLKRIDSDLRLHTKLLEMSNEEGRGASSPHSYTGSNSPEMDID